MNDRDRGLSNFPSSAAPPSLLGGPHDSALPSARPLTRPRRACSVERMIEDARRSHASVRWRRGSVPRLACLCWFAAPPWCRIPSPWPTTAVLAATVRTIGTATCGPTRAIIAQTRALATSRRAAEQWACPRLSLAVPVSLRSTRLSTSLLRHSARTARPPVAGYRMQDARQTRRFP
jgi:hypothetical protein